MGQLQGLLHLKGYWEFDAAKPTGRLERVAHVRNLAGRAALHVFPDVEDHKIAAGGCSPFWYTPVA